MQMSSDHKDIESDQPADIYPDSSLDSSGQSCVTPPNSPSILLSIRKNSELRPSVSRHRESRRKDTPYPAIQETQREGLRDYSGERRKDTPYPNIENMRDIKRADNSPLCSSVSPIQAPKKLSFDDLEESEEVHSGSSIVCSSGIKGRKWEELDSSMDGISMNIKPESSVVVGRYTGIESGVLDLGSNNSDIGEDKAGKIIRTLSELSNEDCTEEKKVITETSEIIRNKTVFQDLELDSYSSCVSSYEGDQGNKWQCSDMLSSEDQVFSDQDQLTGLFSDPGRSSDVVEDEQEPDMLDYL